MNMKANNRLPANIVPPGGSIKAAIADKGWTQRQFAEVLGRPTQFVNELIKGKRQLTATSALELEAALGTPADMWLRLEANYRVKLALRDEQEAQDLEKIRERAAQTRTKSGAPLVSLKEGQTTKIRGESSVYQVSEKKAEHGAASRPKSARGTGKKK
jgi:HTH-type transcriptional regulator/antitoxin HigA